MAIAPDINPQLLKKGIDLLSLDYPENPSAQYIDALNSFASNAPALLKELTPDLAASHPERFVEKAKSLHDLLVKVHAPMLIVHCDNLIQAAQNKDAKVVTTALQLIDAGTSALFDGLNRLENPDGLASLAAEDSGGTSNPADTSDASLPPAREISAEIPPAPTDAPHDINEDNHHKYTEHQLFASLHGLIAKRDAARGRKLIHILSARVADAKFRKMLELIDADLEKEDITSAETQSKLLLVALDSSAFVDRPDTEFSFDA